MEFIAGIGYALSPENLLYAFIGCFVGTLVGVLPGLGAVSAVAILFPFTAYLPPTGMIIALASIYYGAAYGGSTTAILMNVPGEVYAVCTALDGHEMTKQGRPGPALAISAIVSFLAGIVGTLMIAMIGPAIARVALTFGPAEYLGLGIFALTAIAALAGRSLIKGIIVALIGMLLVSVGVDVASAAPRLTFGVVNLLQGFDIVPVMIGLFGIAEVLKSLQERLELVTMAKIGKLMPNREELKTALGAGGRATALSLALGIFPGMMPSIASFLSYSMERQISKHPEKFGKGAIEGVAASEAANNAAAMANLIPLLSLGVPTGPTMALMLAAFTIMGLVPGPLLFTEHAQFVWTVIGSFFVANIILLVLNLPLVGLWVKFCSVPYPILAPIILAICLIGAFSTRSSLFDVWVCLAFGVVGWLMGKGGWPAAPMVLAYVLGPMVEKSARQVLALTPEMLLGRPVFWIFIAMAIVAAFLSHRLSVSSDTTN